MRVLALVLLGFAAAAPSAQTLPQFSDYPAGPIYRGRVAPLDLSSSPDARRFRTRTREAMAEGVDFAGHYVVAMWGCGSGCMSGQIVDARTGRVVSGLPSGSPYVAFQPESRLFVVDPPEQILDAYPDYPLDSIASYSQSEYWFLEGDSLRFIGALLASDLEAVRLGGAMRALRTVAPGDVLVPLAVGNTWTYATAGGTVTYRVAAPAPDGLGRAFVVERVRRTGGAARRTAEAWSRWEDVGYGGLRLEVGDDVTVFDYSFGVPKPFGFGQRIERETVQVAGAPREAICYVVAPNDDGVRPGRACFVPRIGMVSDDRDGAMTLTSYTLR